VAASGQSLAYIDTIAKPTMIVGPLHSRTAILNIRFQVAWICVASTMVTFVLVSLASRHIQKYGSEPTLMGNSHVNGKSSFDHAEKLSSRSA
jgi:hypothetical protein